MGNYLVFIYVNSKHKQKDKKRAGKVAQEQSTNQAYSMFCLAQKKEGRKKGRKDRQKKGRKERGKEKGIQREGKVKGKGNY